MSEEKKLCYPPIATHTPSPMTLTSPNRTKQRIYTTVNRKQGRVMLLTVDLHSWGDSDGCVEVRVNGGPIPDGIIDNIGYSARTFLLEGVVTVDLHLKSGRVHFDYSISVPLPSQEGIFQPQKE